MSKNACSQRHFCEVVNGAGVQSTERQSRKGLRSKTFREHYTMKQNACSQRRGAGGTRFVALTSFVGIGIIQPILSRVLCTPLDLGLIDA